MFKNRLTSRVAIAVSVLIALAAITVTATRGTQFAFIDSLQEFFGKTAATPSRGRIASVHQIKNTANIFAPPAPDTPLSPTAELITNGGFETGNFSGWTATNPTGPFEPWAVGASGSGWVDTPLPTATSVVQGTRNAWHSVTSSPAGSFTLDQQITIPSSTTARLTWMHKYQMNLDTYCSGAAQCGTATYAVEVLNTSNTVLQTLYTITTPSDSLTNTGWLSNAAILTPYAGQTIKIRFRTTVTAAFGGPGRLEIDSVSVQSPAPASTYTWNQTAGGNFGTAANWTPARTTPAADDILVFNNGSTGVVTNVTTQTIGQLSVIGGTNVTLQAGAATQALAIGGGAGALSVANGSQLNVSGTNVLSLNVAAGSTGTISGAMTLSAAAHRLTSVDASGITFGNGSVFTAGTSFSGNPFGTTALNSVIFASGSTYVAIAGSNPFGAGQPSSVVTFQPGSLYSAQANFAPSFSGRTYANVEINSAAFSQSPTGGNACVMDNLTVTAGTLNFNLTATPGHAIRGNISVASGATLNFNPASATTIVLNGTSTQTISGAGTLTANSANSTFAINNTNGITLSRNVVLNNLTLTAGNITTGANTLSVGGAINRTSGHVIGNLQRTYPSASSLGFDVGTGNGYSPVTVNATGGTFPATFTVSATQLAATGTGLPANKLQRYWTLTNSTVASADLTFQYLAGDVTSGTEANYKAYRITPSTGGTATQVSSTTNAGTHTTTATGVTTFSDWTTAEPLAAAPTVTSVSPNSGLTTGGTSVTVNGTDFTGATAVTFDGSTCTLGTVTATTITCTTTAHVAGLVNVAVTTPGGTGTATNAYTYVKADTALAALTVASTGLVGNSLTVSTTLTRTTAPAGAVANETVSFTLTDPASGTSVLSATTDSSGVATVLFPLTMKGAHTVVASYGGNGDLNGANSNTPTVAVYQRTSLAYSGGGGTAGTPVSLSATLTEVSGGTPLSGQTVSFDFGGTPATQTATTDGSGIATVSVNFPGSGTFSSTVSFSSAAAFNANSSGVIGSTTATANVTITAPEMEVRGNNVVIADGDTTPDAGDHTSFNTTSAGGGIVNRTFRINNIGNADLNLTGTPRVVITGANASDFSVTTQPAVSPITGPSGTTTFVVRFAPAFGGSKNATVSIANNDADENPYNFAVNGFAFGSAFLTGTKAASLSTDTNGNSQADPGDVIRYLITVGNVLGTDPATSVVVNDTISNFTTLVSGSIKASPMGVNDSYTTAPNTQLSVPDGATDIMANDLNPNGAVSALQIPAYTPASANGGTVSVSANGAFTYDPPLNFSGFDTFTYTIDNGTGMDDMATVSINVVAARPGEDEPDAKAAAATDKNGTYVAAPGAGETVNQNLGTIPPGESVRLVFDATVEPGPYPMGMTAITNTATVSASGLFPANTNTTSIPLAGPVLPEIQFSAPQYYEDESQTAVVTITRSGDLTNPSSVTFNTAGGGSASGGTSCTGTVDYVVPGSTLPRTINFAASVATQTVLIDICGETAPEAAETLNLALSGASGATLGTRSAAVLNINDTASQFLSVIPHQTIEMTPGAPANQYPSQIVVNGAPNVIGGIRVTLYDIWHDAPDNIDVLLAGPQGQTYVLMADVGGQFDIVAGTPVTLTFSDIAPAVLPDEVTLETGHYRPTSCLTPVLNFAGPAPAGPYVEPGCTLARPANKTLFGISPTGFGMTNPNGTWRLFVRDDNGQPRPLEALQAPVGAIAGGWGIEFLAATAADASISGRVLTNTGRGIRGARITVTGNSLATPVSVITGVNGRYTVPGLTPGETYIVTVGSRRFFFEQPSRVITLNDNVTDADFTGSTGTGRER